MENEGIKPIGRFLGHIIGCAIAFSIVAICATGVDNLVIVLKGRNASEFTVWIMGGLSHIMMVIDTVMLLGCIVISTGRFVIGFYKGQ